jgi:hypothetical protein
MGEGGGRGGVTVVPHVHGVAQHPSSVHLHRVQLLVALLTYMPFVWV